MVSVIVKSGDSITKTLREIESTHSYSTGETWGYKLTESRNQAKLQVRSLYGTETFINI